MQEAALFSFQWWTEPLGTWMAWTRATIAFFLFVFACIATMGIWEFFSPGGNPRNGVLSLTTTRGDRLFISLLGSAYIFIAWLFFLGTPLWWPLALCAVWAVFVFGLV